MGKAKKIVYIEQYEKNGESLQKIFERYIIMKQERGKRVNDNFAR